VSVFACYVRAYIHVVVVLFFKISKEKVYAFDLETLKTKVNLSAIRLLKVQINKTKHSSNRHSFNC